MMLLASGQHIKMCVLCYSCQRQKAKEVYLASLILVELISSSGHLVMANDAADLWPAYKNVCVMLCYDGQQLGLQYCHWPRLAPGVGHQYPIYGHPLTLYSEVFSLTLNMSFEDMAFI